jgi:flagellar secretion chaperone FliS
MDRRAITARRATHMNPQAAQQAQNYLRTRVLTATPEQLQLMLFDGALRFGEQARAALGKRDWEGTYNHIGRVQKIIAELTASLKHDVNPELCGKLASLYNYAHRKLTEACIDHAPEALDEAMKVLRYQRETWVMLLDQLGKQKAAFHAGKIDMPAPAARMEAQIRMTA